MVAQKEKPAENYVGNVRVDSQMADKAGNGIND